MEKRKSEISKEMWRVHKVLGRTYTRREFDEVAKNVTSRTVERVFGTWTDAMEETGLAAEAMKEFDPEKAVDADWGRRKEELKRHAENRRVKELVDQMHKKDLLRAMIEEAVALAEPPMVEVHPVKVVKAPTKGNRQHVTLWFEFTDLQLGTLILSEAMGGLNKHNWPIWLEKLEVWKKGVISRLVEYQILYEVDDVVINCGGDMVEGQDIFRGQGWHIEQHVVNQAIFGAGDTAEAFIEIFKSFPNLRFHITEVFGNHGRIGRKGEVPHSCSMDKVYQRQLELHINAARVNNMTYYRNESWWYLLKINGWNHLILHGDQGMPSLWSNRPTVNGLEKLVARYMQMAQCQVHFVHSGHFHNDWSLSFNMSYLLINGSWIGTSNFSASQMVASSPAMQCLHVFEPRIGLAKTERIYLTDGDVKNPIEPHTLKRKSA